MPSRFGWTLAEDSAAPLASPGTAPPSSGSLFGFALLKEATADEFTGKPIPAGDLALEGGDLVIIRGREYARQKVEKRLKFFLGEWFLDTREGVPYYRDVFVKNPNLEVIRSVFRRTILSVPSVVAVTDLALTLAPDSRELAVEFEAVYREPDSGTLEQFSDRLVFLV